MKVTGELHRRDSVGNYLGTRKRKVCGTNYSSTSESGPEGEMRGNLRVSRALEKLGIYT